MHSLFFRIFILFWLAMALIVGGSIALTVAVASRDSSSDTERRPEMAVRASQVLASGGLPALRRWLDANRNAIPYREFFIIDAQGHDILGRELPEFARHRLEFRPDRAHEPYSTPPADSSAEPAPPHPWTVYRAPRLIGPDGSVYTVLFPPRRPGLFGALSLPGIPLAVLALALMVSALISGWLARHLSAPIRRMQEGARSVASGQLDVRVSAGLEGRGDELAVLARDFDAMADKLRTTRELRTQLLRDVSHELRSPLARIRLALGLARQSTSDPQRQLDRMELDIERLDLLIGQVLKLARLQSADLALAREPVDLVELIEDVVADARFEAQARNCRVEFAGARPVCLPAHRELLRSAIENVLRNAVRYSPDGGCVEVDLQQDAQSVHIHVRDRGPGVPAQELQRIFEPFHRVAESRDRGSGGEGIGLAITAQVMQAHGGSATARIRDGGGLEVTLRLPRAAPASDGHPT